MRFLKNILLIILISYSFFLKGQDPSFTNFSFNKLYFNPAFAGISGGLDFSLSHRVLWPNIPSKFNTSKFSMDIDLSCFKNGLGGIGIIAFNDIEGEGYLRTSSIGIPFSSKIHLNSKNSYHHLLSFGVLINGMQKYIDWNNFIFSDQFDNVDGIIRESNFSPPIESSKFLFDFSAGIIFELINSSNLYQAKENWSMRIGAACHHIFQSKYSFSGFDSYLPRKFNFHINSSINLGYQNSIVIAPYTIYEYQNSLNTFAIGANFLYKGPFAGISYRRFKNNDAITYTAGLKITDYNAFISYSYDHTISNLMSVTGGSHEINIIWSIDYIFCNIFNLRRDSRKTTIKKIHCPVF